MMVPDGGVAGRGCSRRYRAASALFGIVALRALDDSPCLEAILQPVIPRLAAAIVALQLAASLPAAAEEATTGSVTCAKGVGSACGESRSVLPSRGVPASKDAVTDQDLSALRNLGLLPADAEPQPPPDAPAEGQ
jgi:hypothetical protein